MSKKTVSAGKNGVDVSVKPKDEFNELTLPSTGRVVVWRPINLQILRRQVIRTLEREGTKQPQPPLLEVKIGRNGTGTETDYQDPMFRRAYAIWVETVGERLMTTVYTALAAWQSFGEAEQAELDTYKSIFGDSLIFGENERLDWFMQFVVGNDGDWLFNVVTGRSRPTEEGIEQEKKDS